MPTFRPRVSAAGSRRADEARYDGIFVLRTNARVTPLQAVLRYRDLIQVEQLFRSAKALMQTRPIYHASDSAIRGHVFCSFLALVLRKELDERCRKLGSAPNGAMCCATSIACSTPPSRAAARCGRCARKPMVAPRPCCWLPASPHHLGSRPPRRRRSTLSHPNPNVEAGRGVVPRAPEFPEFLCDISNLGFCGVQVE